MKKYFILAAVAIAAMACAKNETVPVIQKDIPVSFSVVNHLQQVKSTTGLTYPTSIPFGTFAWWTAGEWTGVAADQANVFMNNVQISWHSIAPGESEVWAPAETYYWTKSGKITFASYSPYTASGTDKGYSEIPVYDVAKGFLFNNYTIVDGTDVDLMYANLAANCSQTTNADGSTVMDNLASQSADSGYAGVPTIFNHALCRIGFAFRAIGPKNPSVDTVAVRVDSVLIYNIDNKGSFDQSASVKWTTDHANYTDDYDFSPASPLEIGLIPNTAANVASTVNYTDLGENKILLPQSLLSANLATDQKLMVKYSILTHYSSNPAAASDPEYWAEEPLVSTVFLHSGNISAWLANQNITYRISISPVTEAITFDPAVVDWTDVYSSDVAVTPDE